MTGVQIRSVLKQGEIVMDRSTPSTIDNSDEPSRNILAQSIGRRAFLLGATAAVSYRALGAGWAWADDGVGDIKVGVANAVTPTPGVRSEERRVGKECKSRL